MTAWSNVFKRYCGENHRSSRERDSAPMIRIEEMSVRLGIGVDHPDEPLEQVM